MKLNQFITAFICVLLLVLLICIIYARATWEGEVSPSPAQTVSAEAPSEPEQSEAPEPSETPVYYEMYFTEEDVAEVAKMLWGEARGCALDNQQKAVWCVLNRVDDPRFPDTIQGVLSQPSQFHGYSPDFPVWDELKEVALDVLTRWSLEKQGVTVERELLPEYVFFTGDGVQNHFRATY